MINPEKSCFLRHWPLGVILIIACIMLLTNLGNQYLWQDEAETALVAKTILVHGLPMTVEGKNFISQVLIPDSLGAKVWKDTPWFPCYLLAGFFGLFGVGTFMARLPFALFGVATIALAYWAAYTFWKTRRSAVFAAAALLMNVWFLVLCRQCRYYAPDMFFSLAVLLGYYHILRGSRGGALAMVAALVLLFNTQYLQFGALVLAINLHALFCRRDRLKAALIWSGAALIICLPGIIWFAGIQEAYTNLEGMVPPGFQKTAHFSLDFAKQWLQYIFPPFLFAAIALLTGYNWLRKSFTPLSTEYYQNAQLLVIFSVVSILFLAATVPYEPHFRYIGPLIPAACLLMALVAEMVMKLHVMWGVALLGILTLNWPMTDFFYEITHDYNGPIEGIVQYLNLYGHDTDTALVVGEDLPLKLYTRMHIVGGANGEDLSPAINADWLVFRQYIITPQSNRVAEFVRDNIPRNRYKLIRLPFPDIKFENREGPKEHLFRTSSDETMVAIYQRLP